MSITYKKRLWWDMRTTGGDHGDDGDKTTVNQSRVVKSSPTPNVQGTFQRGREKTEKPEDQGTCYEIWSLSNGSATPIKSQQHDRLSMSPQWHQQACPSGREKATAAMTCLTGAGNQTQDLWRARVFLTAEPSISLCYGQEGAHETPLLAEGCWERENHFPRDVVAGTLPVPWLIHMNPCARHQHPTGLSGN